MLSVSLVRRFHVVAQYISPTPESWSCRASSERRQLVLAVALGARSAWSMAMAVVASQVEHVSITVV